ncbi:hypothetical protein [uncultured Sphingomonas sp.]|uniref:hypothetical protein n=1 Tax=uncultured Sphingomonas sp. TaxID=158754 RepID=UPI0035CA10CE
MRLLLLLSALFAALTGAGASARPLGTAVIAASARVVAPERARAHAHVLMASRPSAAVVEPVLAARSDPRPAPSRLWTTRRRE